MNENHDNLGRFAKKDSYSEKEEASKLLNAHIKPKHHYEGGDVLNNPSHLVIDEGPYKGNYDNWRDYWNTVETEKPDYSDKKDIFGKNVKLKDYVNGMIDKGEDLYHIRDKIRAIYKLSEKEANDFLDKIMKER